ncbi:MAG: DUF6069 family protein [Anaerolineae bacterium]|nr:DUF6069 family protein [Candidatus Roseilinea sp.]MDW8448477.1 DUF6069 family protein [Anaerolineae bacterium]
MTRNSLSPSAESRTSFGTIAQAAALGAGIAVVGNLALLLIANLLSIPLTVMTGPPGPDAPVTTLGPAPVIVSSVLPALVGALIYRLLTKISAKGRQIFIAVAVVVFLVSLLPISAQPLTPAGMAILALMHLVAAAGITWALVSRA